MMCNTLCAESDGVIDGVKSTAKVRCRDVLDCLKLGQISSIKLMKATHQVFCFSLLLAQRFSTWIHRCILIGSLPGIACFRVGLSTGELMSGLGSR